ncbi:DUF3054 domain-containing protein [Frigoribacterium sp. SL97]|uniref:DUF3054 domain-containing protein n=1 Tax=Frigoribacterium sp. SL97 TaxID=2994664 RepID=UPI00226F6CA7|nr:DUF3054 domain-containing protein [Frigoribacterium sp. SL97]WAC52874.1 DUF3054 domain-containing protein [Frigoribacterium sp. SL97]
MTRTSPTSSPTTRRREVGPAWWPIVVDLVAVLAFVVIGRRSHAEGLDLPGLHGTLWPFVVGSVVGWASVTGVRWPLSAVRSGAVVWVSTAVIGVLLRVVSGQGVQVSFVVVTVVVLGVFVVGWRAVAALVRR